MDNSQVAVYIGQLKDKDPNVHLKAAEALGKIGDPSTVPTLLNMWPAVFDPYDNRVLVARILWEIGDSDTLPRKILADSRFSAQERIIILESLRRVQYDGRGVTVKYTFPKTDTLCQMVLNEENAAAREGAQTVLDFLNSGGQYLLRASQFDTTNQATELLRAAQGGESETQPKTLLRAADEPEKDVE